MNNEIKALEAALEAAKAAMETALTAHWAVWASIGGEAADKAARDASMHPALGSGFVTRETSGLPRWKKERIWEERRKEAAKAQAASDRAWARVEALRLHPEWVRAQEALKPLKEAEKSASDALFAAKQAAKGEALLAEEAAKRAAPEIASFRWGGKDADGDWAD
jgi:hypothetical protein